MKSHVAPLHDPRCTWEVATYKKLFLFLNCAILDDSFRNGSNVKRLQMTLVRDGRSNGMTLSFFFPPHPPSSPDFIISSERSTFGHTDVKRRIKTPRVAFFPRRVILNQWVGGGGRENKCALKMRREPTEEKTERDTKGREG